MYCYEGKLPQQICINCYWKLKHFSDFKQQCKKSLKILYDILIKNNLDNPVINTDIIKKETVEVKNECKPDVKFEAIVEDNETENNIFINANENLNAEDVSSDYESDMYVSINNSEDEEFKKNDSKRKSLIEILNKKYKIYNLTCNICKKEMRTRQTLLRHMRTHMKNRSKKYKCDFCNKKFYEVTYLEKHRKRHLGKTKYQCDLCPKKYYELTAFGTHYRQTHKIEPIACQKCTLTFNHPLQLKQHEKQIHIAKEFVCHTCGKTFNMRCRLKDHETVHSNDKPFTCQYCNSKFKQNDTLQTHIRVIHVETNRRELCFICGVLLRQGRLGRHLESHNEIKMHKCEMCNKSYSHKYVLRQHIKDTHDNDKEKFVCEVCQKILSSKSSLAQHILFMHSDNNDKLPRIECHICGQVYRRIAHVKRHIKSVHMDQRPHPCTLCKKSFHTKSNLTKHMRSHTGERPFVCTFCDKAYGWREILTNHIRKMHNNDK